MQTSLASPPGKLPFIAERTHTFEDAYLKTHPSHAPEATPQNPSESSLEQLGPVDHCCHHSRKRRAAEEEPEAPACDKRRKVSTPHYAREDQRFSRISYWASQGTWPPDFADMNQPSSDRSRKRGRSISSHSEERRKASSPAAHSAGSERVLQEHGIMFNHRETRTDIQSASADLCAALIAAPDSGDAYFTRSEDLYLRVLAAAQTRNEARVQRDIMPHIIPSAELLYIENKITELQHAAEELSTLWTHCKTLGGPKPKPDYAVGLKFEAFTELERRKLEVYSTMATPTNFTSYMYFPFLVGEAKTGSENINSADRQNSHSASIAVDAIVQLHAAVSEQLKTSLDGRILVFSISHDNERAKISGHFPLFRDGKITFHKYEVESFDLGSHYGRDRNKGANIVREIYKRFMPEHCHRLRTVLAQLPDPSIASVQSLASTGVESQFSAASLDGGVAGGRPALGRGQSQAELTIMKEHTAQQQKWYEEKMEDMKQDYMRQMEQQRELMEQQRKQMEQQRKQMERQLEQMERQREQMERQLEQQQQQSAEQIGILRELLNRR